MSSDKEQPPTPEESTPAGTWPGDDGWPVSEPTDLPSYAEGDPRVLPGEGKTSPPSPDQPHAHDQQ